MDDVISRLFLTLGVALGLVAGQPDPVLVAHAAAAGELVIVDARIDRAFAPGTVELIESGTKVAIRFTAALDGREDAGKTETRALWFDMRSGYYKVDVGGERPASLADPKTARALAADLSDLRLEAGPQPRSEAQVVVSARIGILDSRGEWHEAPVLWNYVSPRVTARVAEAAGEKARGGR
jgi:hypothetical protein